MPKTKPIEDGKLAFPFKRAEVVTAEDTVQAWGEIESYLQQIDRRMAYLQACRGGRRETAIARTKVQEALLWIRESGVAKSQEKPHGS